MDTDDTTLGNETDDDTGSATTSDQTPSTGTDELALARRRQGAAEKARQIAEAKAAETQRQLDAMLASQRSAEEAQIADAAGWKAKYEAERARADEAETKATARILDAKYPNARAKLPEITDEVRLAEIEVLLAEPGAAGGPPTPLKHNEKSTGGSTGETKEPTAAEVKAQLLAMPSPF